jgi:hypothetical protein
MVSCIDENFQSTESTTYVVSPARACNCASTKPSILHLLSSIFDLPPPFSQSRDWPHRRKCANLETSKKEFFGAERGICELKENEFRVSFDPPVKAGPTKFTKTADSGYWVHAWKRAKE